MATIFISYSRRDKRFVQKLSQQIENIYGYTSVWYDRSIEGSDDWWKRITSEIQKCEVFLFLISDTSVASPYCQKELQKAIYNRKIVLPVLLKTYRLDYPASLPDDLSDYMRTIQYLDYRKGYNDLSKLWGALNRITDHSISFVDRWILYNQFEILTLLSEQSDLPGNTDFYKEHQKIISMGYEWNYQIISEQIQTPMEYGDSGEIYAILDMYLAIHNACRDNVDCSEIKSPFLKFRGFDGNAETAYYLYVKFLIEEQGNFAESSPAKGVTLKAGYPMLPKYRKMLDVWQPMGDKRHSLTKEDVERIVKAANT